MAIDTHIWTQIALGDQDAYATMYRYYFGRFYNYGKKFIEDIVLIEDAAHETLLLVWEKRTSLNEIKFANTYFYSIFRNKLISLIKQQKHNHLEGVDIEEPGFNAEQIILEREIDDATKTRLQKAIGSLTPRQREIIFLRYYEGLSYEEVAGITEVTTKATYKTVARALAVLKENMIYPTPILLSLFSGFANK